MILTPLNLYLSTVLAPVKKKTIWLPCGGLFSPFSELKLGASFAISRWAGTD